MRTFFSGIAKFVYRLSALGMRKEFPFVRHAMYTQLRKTVAKANCQESRVLAISHSANLVEILNISASEIVEANYPEVSMFELPYPSNSFDIVIADQVLEHLEGNPQDAIDECYRVLAPGGHLIQTTCFVMGYHGPGDFWRFTPEGLAYLVRNYSQTLEVGGWGHPFVALFTYMGFVWEPVPASTWHPMNWAATARWPSYDYVVWLVAKK